MGREFELKYAAAPEAFAGLEREFPGLTAIAMETAYYDTPGGALSEKYWTLRRRMENGVSVCTIKTPLPDGSRGEWETECGSIEGAIPVLCALGAPAELKALTAGGVIEVCAARFTRLAGPIETPDFTAELALDRGSLFGGGRELPFAEAEVEYKSGNENAMTVFAGELARKYGLTPEKKSKYRRALGLAKGE